MASYSVETRNGNILNVPDFAVLHVDGLEIIGDQTTDWNEPYNKNFLALDKKIMAVESLAGQGIDLTEITSDIADIKTELATIKNSAGGTSYDDSDIQSKITTLNDRVDAAVLSVANKVDKVVGKGLSTEDFTSTEKAKLSLVEAGAQVNTITSVAGKTGAVVINKIDVGLGMVDNTADADKPVSSAVGVELGKKVDKIAGKGLSTNDFSDEAKSKLDGLSNYTKPTSEPISYIEGLEEALSGVDVSSISGDILPSTTQVYNIGSPEKRFKGIYVDEAYLAIHTLYLGDTPVLGTEQDTIVIKADVNQSINIQTTGTGTTEITSQDGVQVSTSGTNADVRVQATGVNSKVRFAGTGGIEMSSPISAQSDLSVSGNLTVTGNIVHNGAQFVVNATTVTAKDNIIVVNQGEVGTGVTAGKAGIQVDRGDASDYQLVFDETIDKWVVGTVGGTFETIATREYVTSAMSSVSVDKSILGLNNVDNTSDINKPVSNATQIALNTKQDSLVLADFVSAFDLAK